MFKRIKVSEISENPVDMIGKKWMLISAGTADKFNMMTASWGGIGFMWNVPVAFAVIRPNRYTYEFVENRDTLTLSFFGEECRKALSLCGSKSGRDTDKVRESGLTPWFCESGAPAFEEAQTVLECRKLYSQMMTPEAFIDKFIIDKWYGDGNFHRLYALEIINAFVKG